MLTKMLPNVQSQLDKLFFLHIQFTLIQTKSLQSQGTYGVVVITTTQLHSTKPELRFCAGSNPARGVSEIRDGENL